MRSGGGRQLRRPERLLMIFDDVTMVLMIVL